MRLLMLTDYGYLAGGAEVMVGQLANNMRNRGHTVRILSSTAGREQADREICIADDWCFGTTGRSRTLVQSTNPRAARRLKQLVRELQPDIVHIHLFLTQLSPLILDELKGIPVIYTAHWYRAICMTGFKMLPGGDSCQQSCGVACLTNHCVPLRDWMPLILQMQLLRTKIRNVTTVVASSETIRRKLEENGFRVDRTIQYGTREVPARCALSAPPRVAFAARMVPEKGAVVLLRAFTQVIKKTPLAVLDIYGDGPQLPELKQLARHLGLETSVVFHGYTLHDQLEQAVEKAWVQVAPTLCEEPGGIVAYEAAMRGTAVVASMSGGYKDSVIKGETGYLAPPGDSDKLATALTRLLSDMPRAEKFGAAGRKRAKRQYSEDSMMEQYEALYFQLHQDQSR